MISALGRRGGGDNMIWGRGVRRPLIPHSWAQPPTLTTGPRSLCCTKQARVKVQSLVSRPRREEMASPRLSHFQPQPAAATRHQDRSQCSLQSGPSWLRVCTDRAPVSSRLGGPVLSPLGQLGFLQESWKQAGAEGPRGGRWCLELCKDPPHFSPSCG